MNKDQRLLEEAYEKVHNLDLLPEEELFIQRVCEDILNTADKNVGRRKLPQRQDLNGVLFQNPIFDHLHLLKHPDDIKKQAQFFYSDVQDSVSRNTYVQTHFHYPKGSAPHLKDKFFSFYSPQANSPTQFDLKTVEFNDTKKALEEFKKAYVAHFKKELKNARRDNKDLFGDLLAWRDKRFRDIETTKELSKDFDISALEDFS